MKYFRLNILELEKLRSRGSCFVYETLGSYGNTMKIKEEDFLGRFRNRCYMRTKENNQVHAIDTMLQEGCVYGITETIQPIQKIFTFKLPYREDETFTDVIEGYYWRDDEIKDPILFRELPIGAEVISSYTSKLHKTNFPELIPKARHWFIVEKSIIHPVSEPTMEELRDAYRGSDFGKYRDVMEHYYAGLACSAGCRQQDVMIRTKPAWWSANRIRLLTEEEANELDKEDS